MAGWFDFVNGQTLPASRVQDYLMDQSVMVFANAAAREAALPLPTSGMVSYLVDQDRLYVAQSFQWRQIIDIENLPAQRNAIINGAFDFWARGTSFTSPSFSAYTADRFKNNNYDFAPTTYSITRESFTPGTVPAAGVMAQYFYRSTITTVGSNTQYDTAQQRIEDVSSFAGSTVTISFYAKADSARTVKLGAGQVFGSGGSGSVTISNYALQFNLTTSWQRFSATIAIPSISGKTVGAGSYLWFAFRQASSSGSVFDLWGVQLEAGSIATKFVRAGGTLQGELAACQRYYYRIGSETAFQRFQLLTAQSATASQGIMSFPVTMRAAPTSIEFSALATLGLSDGVGGTITPTAITLDQPNTKNTNLSVGGTGMTAYRNYYLIANNNATAFIGVSSEL